MDDFSRAIWIYLLIDKREVSRTLVEFFSLIERKLDKRVKMILSDNGIEFICLKNYFREHMESSSKPFVQEHHNRIDG